jgi:hypothetical protein
MNSMFAVLFKFLVTMNHQIALMNYVADLEDFGRGKFVKNFSSGR